MTDRLKGKVAIVTGGSRGIGAAIAMAYAKEGAKVVVASRKEPGVLAAAQAINAEVPGSTFGRACHVGQTEAIAELIEWTTQEVGQPNVLVNNAGTNPYFGPMMGATMGAWDKTFEINLKGPFEATRLVAKSLIASKMPGSIINVSSIAGLRAMPMQGIYAMTKAALISMTQTMAIELGSGNIRVNAIAPGLVETRLAAAVTALPEAKSVYTDRTAQKRVGQPHEIAGAAVFLASDESSFMTGQVMCLDGGWTAA